MGCVTVRPKLNFSELWRVSFRKTVVFVNRIVSQMASSVNNCFHCKKNTKKGIQGEKNGKRLLLCLFVQNNKAPQAVIIMLESSTHSVCVQKKNIVVLRILD